MSSRMPLLLIPGLLCDQALWAHQVETLADIADIHVAEVTRQDTISAMAAHVLAQAPRRFALAGLSMGGYVAQEIMRQAPERVIRLALLDTSPHADTPEQTTRRKALIEMAQIGRFKGVTPRLLPLLIHGDRLEEAALVTAVMGMAERVGQAAFIRQQTAIMGRADSLPHLSHIAVPTLVLCGRQDALTPPELHQEMADRVADARLVVVENCGHLAPLEHPEAVSAVFRYWLQD